MGMENDNKLSFFFLGLGLGVAAGVLFAPKSGSETRDYLRSRANEGADYLKHRAGESADYLKHRADEGADMARRRAGEFRDSASDAFERGKSTLQKHRDNLNAAMEAGRQAYRDAVNNPTPGQENS